MLYVEYLPVYQSVLIVHIILQIYQLVMDVWIVVLIIYYLSIILLLATIVFFMYRDQSSTDECILIDHISTCNCRGPPPSRVSGASGLK